MEFIAIKTASGLRPAFDSDFEIYSKIKIGDPIKITFKKVRNLEFHRKYFALINCAWQYQNEKTTNHFKCNIELFRKTVEISAGHCDMIYSISRKEWVEIPKTISFSSMDNNEFSELYERVKDVIFNIFLKNITTVEFEKTLLNF